MADEIDPQFPFIQVSRGVAAKAAALAPVLDVTYQHARGALDCFWEGLADRRILGGKPELILPADDVANRLELAFGKPVPLPLMVSQGFLEPRRLDDGQAILNGYRIRGMSRYLVAEATRRKKKGTPPAPETDSGPPTVTPQSDPGATRVPPPVAPQVPPGSHPTEVRGERREVRGETEELMIASGEEFFRRAQDSRHQMGAVEEAPPARGLSAWFSEAMMLVNGDSERLWAGWQVYLKDPYWFPRKNPWAGWLLKWRECTPAKPVGKPPGAPSCCICGGKGGCGSEAVPLCWEHAQEAIEWCAGKRIDMWEQGGLERWRETRDSSGDVRRMADPDTNTERQSR